jgi:hypothetical protein
MARYSRPVYSYLLHGVRVESNRQIDGVPVANPTSEVDCVAVHFGAFPDQFDERAPSVAWYESAERYEDGTPGLRIRRMSATGDLWLRYADHTQFLINAATDVVFARWPAELTFDDTVIYFLGPVMGILLRARARTCLHASVVRFAGHALGFLGPAGAGKSTVAATFARAGHAVLSDDLLALTERTGFFRVDPGYSRLRLWPESVAVLYESPDALPRLVDTWDKRYLDLAAAAAFCDEALPLGGIYLIGDRRTRRSPPVFEPLTPRAALLALITNTYAARLPGRSERRRDFELFTRLTSQVPLRKVTLGGDWGLAGELPAAVLEDFTEARAKPAA